jgi:queuine tRNA-ribosyltransferase
MPIDLLRAIEAGIDMFDCTIPTRNARNGQALTWGGRVNIKQARHLDDAGPLDARCNCPVCTTYSRAYLRHLSVCGEILASRFLTQHNLHFFADLMSEARHAIGEQRFAAFAKETETRFLQEDEVGNSDPE